MKTSPYGKLNSNQQLNRLKEAIVQQRPDLAKGREIVFQQEQRQAAHIASDLLEVLEAWLSAFYAFTIQSGLAPSDYNLFLSMANDFASKIFASKRNL